MRKLLFCVILGLCGLSAFAQNQKFRIVSDENELMKFSTVYVNGKALTMANKDAEALIPREQLKNGDTISASYVGYETGQVIYDGYKKNGYVIRLNMGQLEKITVYGKKETRKEFRAIDDKYPVSRAGDFKFSFVFEADGREVCRGDFYHYLNLSVTGLLQDPESSDHIPGTSHNRMYVEPAEKFIPILQDEEKVEMMKNVVIPMLQNVFYTTSRASVTDLMHITYSHTTVRKTAEKGKIKTFLLSRTGNGKSYDEVVNSTVYVDVDTMFKTIVTSRMDIQRPEGRLELTASYLNYQTFRYPNVIEATYTTNDGTEYLIDIYDVEMIKKKDKVHVFKKSSSMNIWDLDNELFTVDGALRYHKGEYSEQITKDIKEELDAAGGDLSNLVFREHIERLGLANWVE